MKSDSPLVRQQQKTNFYQSRLSRRIFLRQTVTSAFGLLSASALSRALGASAVEEKLERVKSNDVFDRLVAKAGEGKWSSLPIGDTIGAIAKEVEGPPHTG